MTQPPSRRQFLLAAGSAAAGLGLASLIHARPAHATPTERQDAIRKVVGSARVGAGKVKLELPPLVENGNAVPITISVESPMTQADHVKAIHVFTEKKPQPDVVSFRLGPRAGRASVGTRIRLPGTHSSGAPCALTGGSTSSG